MEKFIELKLKKLVELKGGMCVKMVFPGTRGAPDRFIVKSGQMHLVETKSKTGKPSPIQKAMHRLLARHGVRVWIVYNEETLNEFLNEI